MNGRVRDVYALLAAIVLLIATFVCPYAVAASVDMSNDFAKLEVRDE